MSQFKIKCFNAFTDDLKILWESFEDKSVLYVFQTFTWCKHWFDTVGIPNNYFLHVLIISDNEGHNLMLLPFVRKKNIIWKIEWIGGFQFDYNSPICSKNHFWSEVEFNSLWVKLVHHFKKMNISYCHLKNQPEFIESLGNPFFSYLDSYQMHKSNFIDFKIEADYFSKPSLKKILADSKRQKKRLNEIDNVSIIFSEKSDCYKNQVAIMIEQKKVQYLELKSKNLLASKSVKSFYLDAFDNKIQQIHMSCLKLGDKIIATHWGAIFRNRFYYLMPSFDRGEFAKFSPGKILLEELIHLSIENKIDFFDFTIGGENYKKDWCNSGISLSNSAIPITLFGCIVTNYIRLKSFLILKILKIKFIMVVYRFFKKYVMNLYV